MRPVFLFSAKLWPWRYLYHACCAVIHAPHSAVMILSASFIAAPKSDYAIGPPCLVCWCSLFLSYALECLSLALRLLLSNLSSSSSFSSSSLISSPISRIRNSKPLLALLALSLVSSLWLFFLMLFSVFSQVPH